MLLCYHGVLTIFALGHLGGGGLESFLMYNALSNGHLYRHMSAMQGF